MLAAGTGTLDLLITGSDPTSSIVGVDVLVRPNARNTRSAIRWRKHSLFLMRALTP